MANRVDPDQMPCSAASDLGLHCLLRFVVQLHSVNTVIGLFDEAVKVTFAYNRQNNYVFV